MTKNLGSQIAKINLETIIEDKIVCEDGNLIYYISIL